MMVRAMLAVFLSTAAAGAQTPERSPTMTRLTDPQDDYAEYSPDGQWIVFQSNRSGSGQLWLMRRDGSNLRRLTDSTANDRTPS